MERNRKELNYCYLKRQNYKNEANSATIELIAGEYCKHHM